VTKQIYLDYNATVPILKEVKNSLISCMDIGPLNASSIHYFGRKGKDIINEAKTNISNLINANNREIIFTGSATEAINLLFSNFDNIIVSSIEHLAVLSSSKSNHIIPVDKNGLIDLNYLDLYLKKNVKNKKQTLVSVMWVNNETGVIQPINEVVRIAKKYECLVHSDAAQALGKIKINLEETALDFITLSGHKIGAPTGIGALIYSNKLSLIPQILGGGQEKGLRAGTENILGIRGFGEAAKLMKHSPNIGCSKVKFLRDYLTLKVKALKPDTLIFGENANRVENTLLMALPNIPGDLALMKLDLESFSVSSGSACSSGKISKSHVISAMGYDRFASNSVRLSFPPNDVILNSENLITTKELDRLARCWSNL
jgi:cysteine desulfurase